MVLGGENSGFVIYINLDFPEKSLKQQDILELKDQCPLKQGFGPFDGFIQGKNYPGIYFYTVKKNNWPLGLLVSVIISVIISLPRTMREGDSPAWGNFFGAFIYLFPYCLLSWILHSWFGIYAMSRLKPGRRIAFALFAILSVAAVSLLYDWIYTVLLNSFFDGGVNYQVRKPYALSIRSIIISCLYYFIIYYLNLLSEKQKNAIEIEQLKQAQLQAKLASLKEQLSPHFLFNSLNTLSTLIREQEVKKYIYELANVYRYMLQYKEKDIATLQSELNFIRSYLYIIKTRLEDAIRIHIQVDNKLLPSKVPPLTLQILIENVIKHNIAAEKNPLDVRIFSEGDGWLVVQNKLVPRSSVLHTTGIGLNNVIQRYDLLFGKEIIIEKKQEEFSIKLPIVP